MGILNKMLYKVTAMGYFGGVAKVSRGPWFKEYFVEDDGLDWFYTFMDSNYSKCYLLSNNLSVEDRTTLSHMYHTNVRNNRIAWLIGAAVGFEACIRTPRLRAMALGWRMLSGLGVAWATKTALMAYSAQNYNPIVGAFFRK